MALNGATASKLIRVKKYMSYLHTIKRLCNFWGVFHFEEGAQVSRGVEQLYLKTFVAECHLTADKVKLCIKSLLFTHVVENKHRGKTIEKLFHAMCSLQWIHIKRTRIKYLIILTIEFIEHTPGVNDECWFRSVHVTVLHCFFYHHIICSLQKNRFHHYATLWLSFTSNYTCWNN